MNIKQARKFNWITQQYACCEPIAILNAALYHGIEVPRPGSREFEEIVDLTGCRHGSALATHKLVERLGLEERAVDLHPRNAEAALPIAFYVWTQEMGYHAVLIVSIGKDFNTAVVNLTRKRPVSIMKYVNLLRLLPGVNVGEYAAASIQPAK